MELFEQINERDLVATAEEDKAAAGISKAAANVSKPVSACKCQRRWLDETCISRAINAWIPEDNLMSWGSHYGKGANRALNV